MPGRDFDSKAPARADPVWFKLGGQRWDCVDDVNGKRLFDNIALLDGESVADQRDGVIAIFEDAVIEDQRDAFFEMLNDPKTVFELTTLVEVAGWLAEQYTERPTEQPAQSPNGRANAGRTSTAKRAEKAATSRRSTRAHT